MIDLTAADRRSSSVTWRLPRVDLAGWAIERAMHPSWPTIEARDVGWVSTAQMREIDHAMTSEYGVSLLQMMEHAGTNTARLVTRLASPSTVAVYVGSGGNGGGGLAAARHLHNHGIDVTVVRNGAGSTTEATALQLDSVRRLGIGIVDHPVSADVAVDALIGYSLRGALDEHTARLTRAMRKTAPTVISLDVPTGLNATTGHADPAAVLPDVTLTLCLPKHGLIDRTRVGELFLADIGVPPSLTRRVSGGAPSFRVGPILRVTREAGA